MMGEDMMGKFEWFCLGLAIGGFVMGWVVL